MRNNKGFTLMELIAALFIGGMVTAALVLVWKTASLQTSQSQSQTIINNKVSNYRRQLYKDIRSTDIVLAQTDLSNNLGTLLSGLKKARRIADTKFKTSSVPNEPSSFFTYCTNKDEKPDKILRYEHALPADELLFSSYSGNSYLESCRRNGQVVLNDVGILEYADCGYVGEVGRIKCVLDIEKTFTPASGLTPIKVNGVLLTSFPGGE